MTPQKLISLMSKPERKPLWNIKPDNRPKSTKQVMRALIEAGVKCGWLVKWGGKYDLCYPGGRMVPTGLISLGSWTNADWVEFAKKHENE